MYLSFDKHVYVILFCMLAGHLKVPQYKYSFHKKLGLRFATIYSWCLSNKPLHISKADTKNLRWYISSKSARSGLHTIPCLKYSKKKPEIPRSFIHLYFPIRSATLWYQMRYCSISHDFISPLISLATAMPIAFTAFVLTAYDCTRHLYE